MMSGKHRLTMLTGRRMTGTFRALPLLLAALSFSTFITAQPLADTIIHVQDVIISASRNDHFRHDVSYEEYRGALLRHYEGESLSRLLLSEGALNIRSNGAGGAASSLALRGVSSGHVQVNWNGFPINSVTLGTTDFSMIPAAGFDRVTLVYGASGAVYGSGTFGGAVSLSSELAPSDTLSGSLFAGWQSLGTYRGGLSLRAGNERVAGRLSAWGGHSANRFSYYDYIMQSERIQNDGAWSEYGMIQNLSVKLSAASQLEAGVWYQVKPYSIPSRIGSTSFEQQSDSTLKLFMGYRLLGSRWSLKLKAARFSDRQNYTMKGSADAPVNSIESRIASVQYYGDAGFRYHLPSGLSLDAGITGSLISAEVSAYGGIREERGVALFGGVRQTLDRVILQAALRKEWYNTFSSGVLPSAGLRWEAIPGRWTVRANYSQKYRKPTFNDLYWIPGGNPELRPESGFTLEAGTDVILIKGEHHRLTAGVTPYFTRVRDMIVWRPAGIYWAPLNYQDVRSGGADLSVTFAAGREKRSWNSSLKMALNHSVARERGSHNRIVMLYNPRVIASWKNSFTLGLFDLEITDSFTADRYFDEGRLLRPFNLIDVRTGVNIPVSPGSLGLHLTCNNATDTTYELIRLYPMPGRYWSLKLDYSF